MVVDARFAHTNLIAKDWRLLARFYEQVFGCRRVPPSRSLKGAWLELATGVQDACLEGVHLQLPGFSTQGPTLEIFQYGTLAERPPTATNRPGYGHIAFQVDDVEAALAEVLTAGGEQVGERVSVPIAGTGTVTFVYATDPEGNIIELQNWS